MKRTVLLLILLTACDFTTIQEQTIDTTGTSALELSIHPATQTTTYQNTQANIYLQLHNTGTADIKNGMYTWIYEPQYWQQERHTPKTFTLNGKNQYNPYGDTTEIQLTLTSKTLQAQEEHHLTNIIFQACYEYETHATIPICIDPDIQQRNPNKVCRPQTTTYGSGQGAPVAITSVEPIMLPQQDKVTVALAITIRNQGSGTIINRNAIAEICGLTPTTEGRTLFNAIELQATIGQEKLNCQPDEIKLEPYQDTKILCRSTKLYGIAQGTFSTVANIDINYGYTDAITHTIDIRKLS